MDNVMMRFYVDLTIMLVITFGLGYQFKKFMEIRKKKRELKLNQAHKKSFNKFNITL